MLVTLSIRDIVLIDRLDLDFAEGMSVLTGETGAGKSILLDALSLAIGGRGDADLVRHGEAQGQVTAVFDVPGNHAARALLRENGVDDDGDLILRRIQTADGRTRAFINDQPVSVGLMRQAGTLLVEIHGQHDDRALVDPDSHRLLIDSFGALTDDVDALGEAYKAFKAAEKAVRDHEARIETARQEADYLKSAVSELTALAPQAGEEDELAARRTTMMQVEKIAGDLNEAFETLNGTASPIPELASLLRRMERKTEQAPALLTGPVTALANALDNLEEARSGLETAVRETDFDPRELEAAEERLFALRAASRKFSVPVDELAGLCARMSEDLADLDAGEDKLAALKATAVKTRDAYDKKAKTVSKAREKAARQLEQSVGQELPALKLERARFIVEMASDPENRSRTGIDQLEFYVQTNPGTKPGPMMKVASGGELSRFLLALKVSLADKGSAPTLVFDEIDTGVGGAVAEAIGVRLARLAANVQVLTVTHAPQVAARAAGHFLIAKEEAHPERVATRVRRIDEDHRREEIARMLAGSVITEEARAAAGKLITEATG
jgi:DNA repair protein RecN (Recombination protein N)